MNKEKEEHCHYSGLPSPKAYAKDDIDYDGMGNQGRVPVRNEDNKDWYLMFCCALVGAIAIILLLTVVSCNNTKCIGSIHKTKYHHRNTCQAFK